jgi:hypothetical protein
LSHIIPVPLALLVAALVMAPSNAAPVVVYAAGDIAECRGKPAERSGAALTAKLVPAGATVLIPGDTAYPFATTEILQSCYQPTWGAFRATTLVAPGNHDYIDGRSDDFRAYFGDGAAATGYFARRVGDWLVIALDSEQAGGSLERQFEWLKEILRENGDVRCSLAFWHRPAFSSGIEHGSSEKMQRFWALLHGNGVEFALNGHEHFYEAFGPLDATGHEAADGMREFVVGTGGARLYPTWSPLHQSRVRHARHGVLKLTLDAGSYAWQFIDTRGRVLDAGEAACRQ